MRAIASIVMMGLLVVAGWAASIGLAWQITRAKLQDCWEIFISEVAA